MRTTLDIDETLLRDAMERANAKTKTDTVHRGLRELINAVRKRQLIRMRGQGYGMNLQTFLRHRMDE